MGMTTVRRERRLPQGAIGQETVRQNEGVEPITVVLKGDIPGEFLIVDSLKALGLRSAASLDPATMLRATPGARVEAGRPILETANGRRAFRAPVDAIFARLEGSRVILQTNPVPVEVKALMTGIVTAIRREDNAVVIESIGALVQGAWGNGKGTFGQLALEPEAGLEALQNDDFIKQLQGKAVIINRPIVNPAIFMIANQQEIGALIVPSMRANLREAALRLDYPIFLTEGFGEMQMSEVVYNLLRTNVNRGATIDAIEPSRWTYDRPEIVIALPSGGTKPRTPEKDQPLVEGAVVRITRPPLLGKTGRVRRVAEEPRTVDNGLRLMGAEVQLSDGQVAFVPLMNLELLGRPPEGPSQGRA
jgi:hypothetical protein